MSVQLRVPPASWPAKRPMTWLEVLSRSVVAAVRSLLRKMLKHTWLRRLQAPAEQQEVQEEGHVQPKAGGVVALDSWQSLTLHCDAHFAITRVQPELSQLLKYKPGALIGKSVLVLMPEVVSDAHAAVFRRLKEAEGPLKASLVAGHTSRCREATLLDSEGCPLSCRLFVTIHADLSSKLVIKRPGGKIAASVPRGFGRFLHQAPKSHLVDCQEVACIMTDVANTTRFAASQPPRVMAELLHKVYVTADTVVQREAYPYVYIHEAVGDSLLLLCNADFMAHYPGRTAAMAIYVAAKVQKAVDEMLAGFAGGGHGMYLRIGIALGPLCAGVVDGRNFRVFGSTIHLSQRLESICPRARVACCQKFTSRLLEEVSQQDVDLETASVDLKGFGTVECSVVDFLGSRFPGRAAIA